MLPLRKHLGIAPGAVWLVRAAAAAAEGLVLGRRSRRLVLRPAMRQRRSVLLLLPVLLRVLLRRRQLLRHHQRELARPGRPRCGAVPPVLEGGRALLHRAGCAREGERRLERRVPPRLLVLLRLLLEPAVICRRLVPPLAVCARVLEIQTSSVVALSWPPGSPSLLGAVVS